MAGKRHLLTIALEDYYHVSPLKGIIAQARWNRFERRLEIGTNRTLDLLDEFGIRGTFFVLGWVADAAPELVRKVADRGHEIASKGYFHQSIRQMPPGKFRDDLARAREALERAAGQRVVGYRVAQHWFDPNDLWALEVLAEQGYAYDSSIKPVLRAYARERWRRFAHRHPTPHGSIWEFPPSTADVLGFAIPIAGGNYFRQLPHALVKRSVAKWDRSYDAPFVMYFHTWELDPHQPRIHAAPLLQRVRQYRNLSRMEGILRDYFREYRFEGISRRLGIAPAAAGPPAESSRPLAPVILEPPRANGNRLSSVSVVIPCYNEQAVLPYLSNTLEQVADKLSPHYSLRFILVNDGSTDGSRATLEELFAGRPNFTVIHHPSNQGVAAAILTGIRSADTEIVCSIDCDCTYDPLELGAMIPLLVDGVDLVTASPYHHLGGVRNVPGWRLALSRSASASYRLVLRQKLQTYTSCFRVYRRSAVLSLPLREPGYLGITELLGLLDLRGGIIVEHPAVLEARLLGHSKMKVLRNILGHTRLLGGLLRQQG